MVLLSFHSLKLAEPFTNLIFDQSDKFWRGVLG